MAKKIPRKSINLNSDSIISFTPTNNTDISSKKYVDDSVAGISSPILLIKKIINFNDASPITLGTLTANYVVKQVEIKSLTPIDVSASLKLGIAGAIEDILSEVEIGDLNTFTSSNGLIAILYSAINPLNTFTSSNGLIAEYSIAKSDGTDLYYTTNKALIATLTQTGATAGQFEILIIAYKI